MPILGWTAILEKNDSIETRIKAVEAIERNARLQVKLVEDLLDISRIMNDKMPLELSVVDLSDLLHSALDTIADTAAAKEIKVKLDDTNESLAVKGDASRLQQAFVNILSNAVKFTATSGHVRVTVEQAGKESLVHITDTGKGISPKFLPHVFEIFRQQEEGTRRHHGGLGIGLALTKRIVELHGGSVQIASEGEGRGTEVTVRLPVETRDYSNGDLDYFAGRDDPASLKGLTLLAVEDTEDSLEVLCIMLRDLGAHVLTARDGVEALQVLATTQPDLVLCDLRMPGMDGFEFIRELSRIQGPRHPPVVAMTGLTGKVDHNRTQAAGFDCHLDKPFDDKELVSAVRSTLDRRRSV